MIFWQHTDNYIIAEKVDTFITELTFVGCKFLVDSACRHEILTVKNE